MRNEENTIFSAPNESALNGAAKPAGSKEQKTSPAKRVAVAGILAALALALSFLESLLPALPFLPPGAKLGLSNIVVLFSVLTASLPQAMAIVVIKSAFTLFTAGGSAFFISLCGGLLSCLVMFLLTRLRQGTSVYKEAEIRCKKYAQALAILAENAGASVFERNGEQ